MNNVVIFIIGFILGTCLGLGIFAVLSMASESNDIYNQIKDHLKNENENAGNKH